MNLWSHLSNAQHVDRIIESVKSHPKVWVTSRKIARTIVDLATYDAAYNTVLITAYNAGRHPIQNAAVGAAREAAHCSGRIMAWNAILALIAYDDAAKYLDMTSDKLKVWAVLSEDPAAVLMLPAVVAYEQISELETV